MEDYFSDISSEPSPQHQPTEEPSNPGLDFGHSNSNLDDSDPFAAPGLDESVPSFRYSGSVGGQHDESDPFAAPGLDQSVPAFSVEQPHEPSETNVDESGFGDAQSTSNQESETNQETESHQDDTGTSGFGDTSMSEAPPATDEQPHQEVFGQPGESPAWMQSFASSNEPEPPTGQPFVTPETEPISSEPISTEPLTATEPVTSTFQESTPAQDSSMPQESPFDTSMQDATSMQDTSTVQESSLPLDATTQQESSLPPEDDDDPTPRASRMLPKIGLPQQQMSSLPSQDDDGPTPKLGLPTAMPSFQTKSSFDDDGPTPKFGAPASATLTSEQSSEPQTEQSSEPQTSELQCESTDPQQNGTYTGANGTVGQTNGAGHDDASMTPTPSPSIEVRMTSSESHEVARMTSSESPEPTPSQPQYPELAEPYDASYVYKKGDAVFRKGEKHIVVKVDYTLEPHAYDVKRQRDGAVINTEAIKLRPARGYRRASISKSPKAAKNGEYNIPAKDATPAEPIKKNDPRKSSPVAQRKKKHLPTPERPKLASTPSGSPYRRVLGKSPKPQAKGGRSPRSAGAPGKRLQKGTPTKSPVPATRDRQVSGNRDRQVPVNRNQQVSSAKRKSVEEPPRTGGTGKRLKKSGQAQKKTPTPPPKKRPVYDESDDDDDSSDDEPMIRPMRGGGVSKKAKKPESDDDDDDYFNDCGDSADSDDGFAKPLSAAAEARRKAASRQARREAASRGVSSSSAAKPSSSALGGLYAEESSDSDDDAPRKKKKILKREASGTSRGKSGAGAKQAKKSAGGKSPRASTQYFNYDIERKRPSVTTPRGVLPTEIKVGGNPPIGPRGRVDRKLIGRKVFIDYGEPKKTLATIQRWDPAHERYICIFTDGQEPDLFTWDDLYGSDCEIQGEDSK